jgi:hypothetical protein
MVSEMFLKSTNSYLIRQQKEEGKEERRIVLPKRIEYLPVTDRQI